MMGAGKAVCDCDLPNSCICKIDITSNIKGAPTYTYNQKGNLPNIAAHDSKGEGADVKINVISKGCIGKHSDCPKGIIYDQYGQVYKTVVGNKTYQLKYTEEKNQNELSSKYNIVSLITLVLLANFKQLPFALYRFRVTECQGNPLVKASPSSAVQVGTYTVSDSEIQIYPNYKLSMDVTIGLESEVKELTADERREIMRDSNQQSGKGDNHTGWTRRTGKQSVQTGISINGSASVIYGNLPEIKKESDTLKKEFARYKNKLSLLDHADKALSTVGKMFSTPKDGGGYPIFRSEFAYPKLKINGTHELAFSKQTTQPYLRGKVSVGLDPLVGVKFTIDLIQAFAAQYGSQRFVEVLREAGAAGESGVKSGRNGAYLGAVFDLIVSGSLSTKFSVETDENLELCYKADERLEGKLSIAADLTLRAGAKIGFISGYFKAGGGMKAEGCFGLLPENKELYLVFYHNGVQAEYWVEYGIGEDKQPQNRPAPKRNDRGVVTGRTTTQVTTSDPFKGKNKKVWKIHKGLTKAESTYRIKLSG
ncbi:hypothetical protein [Serratia silvae]|uniref:Uncharacterized protein n=1 Tax=Serratia silvae TaxID=2824122 RepID=A0ABT0KHI0_9GAMM|nr:hypothetical protein [Serratia silvae]MCL1031490.1 hypothetical protein [Serratia silvae]